MLWIVRGFCSLIQDVGGCYAPQIGSLYVQHTVSVKISWLDIKLLDKPLGKQK